MIGHRQLALLITVLAAVGVSACLTLGQVSAAHSRLGAARHPRLPSSARALTRSSQMQRQLERDQRKVNRFQNQTRSVGPSALQDGAQPVLEPFQGNCIPPNCAFRPLPSSLDAPGDAPTAALVTAPADLGQSAGAAHSAQGPVPSGAIAFGVPSVTRYTGSGGTLYITVIVPNSAAFAEGLYLGTPSGTLPNGSQLYSMTATERAPLPTNFVQWVQNGQVIELSSPDLSVSRLVSLAESVKVS